MAATNTTDISEEDKDVGWGIAEFFREVNFLVFVIPIMCVLMSVIYWWKWRKKKQLQEQGQAQGNTGQGQNNQQNTSGMPGFLHRIFVGTAPPPVNQQTNPGTTQYSRPPTAPFSSPPVSYSVPGQQQTTQYTHPFDRPPPPPYPGFGNTTGN